MVRLLEALPSQARLGGAVNPSILRVQNHGVSNPVCGIGLLHAGIPDFFLGDFLPCIISTYLYSQKKFVENCENLHYKLSSTELVPCIQGLIQDSAY